MDYAKFPLFAHARKDQRLATLHADDCLFLPNGWHHHVFSEADASAGYNLALNLWILRDLTLGGGTPDQRARFPTLGELGAAIAPILAEEQRASGDADGMLDIEVKDEGDCMVDDG